jgi:frataxin-like iron-binding protein CyaY
MKYQARVENEGEEAVSSADADFEITLDSEQHIEFAAQEAAEELWCATDTGGTHWYMRLRTEDGEETRWFVITEGGGDTYRHAVYPEPVMEAA